jgi:hypothetical protein
MRFGSSRFMTFGINLFVFMTNRALIECHGALREDDA